MVAVQSPHGLTCGAARGLDNELLLFEVEADLPIGGSVTFRLELPGLDENVMGTLGHIGQARSETGRRTWTGRIVSLEPSDREVFEVWRGAAERGNRAMTHTRLVDPDGWASAGTMSGATASERAHAMAAQEERRRRRLNRARELASARKKGWPDPTDDRSAEAKQLFSELSSVTGRESLRTAPPSTLTNPSPFGPSGRASVAAVLRDRLGAVRPPPLAARPPPTPPPVAVIAAATLDGDPSFDVRSDGVHVRWQSPETYLRDWRQHLRASALMVPRALVGGDVHMVHLRLPSGTEVSCSADVVHRAPASTGLTLRLGPDDRVRLRPLSG